MILSFLGLTQYRSMATNASDSPLLQLPFEVRDLIWTELLGGRLIHVVCRTLPHDWSSDPPVYVWGHVVCENDCPENGAKGNKGYGSKKKKKEHLPKPHESCDEKLSHVGTKESPVQDSNHSTMSLGLLRACRQTYAEANQILWGSNTFSFTDGITLTQLMTARTIHQKRLIGSLRLEMDWFFEQHRKDWNSALSMALFKTLSGLRNLRLYIIHDVDSQYDFSHRERDKILNTVMCFEVLRKLSTLPLVVAEVAVCNRSDRPSEYPWTQKIFSEITANLTVTDKLTAMLLDPDGPAVYAAALAEEADQRKREEKEKKRLK